MLLGFQQRHARFRCNLDHEPKFHAFLVELQRPLRYARKIHQIIDQPHHVVQLPFHDPMHVGAFRIRRAAGARQNLHGIADRGERISQFMCQRGKKLVFAPIRIAGVKFGLSARGNIAKNEDDLLCKRAQSITKHQLLITFLYDEELALDAPLQVHQNGRHLLPIQFRHLQRALIVFIDLRTHSLPDDADEACSLLEANDVLKRPGQLSNQDPQKYVPFQGDGRARALAPAQPPMSERPGYTRGVSPEPVSPAVERASHCVHP
ncbi:MAG TPA: hypothetical protein VIY90_06825 [Steroidobacteraceae bacterium]